LLILGHQIYVTVAFPKIYSARIRNCALIKLGWALILTIGNNISKTEIIFSHAVPLAGKGNNRFASVANN
jgi:hypothetical protein